MKKVLKSNEARYVMMLLIVSLATVKYATAQQTTQFSQYHQSMYVVNPAATGLEKGMRLNSGFRKQWLGLGQEPSTFYVGGEKAMNIIVKDRKPLALRTSHNESYHVEQKDSTFAKVKHGVGAFIMNDRYGAFRKNVLNLSYAAHYGLNENISISAGLSTGISNLNMDQSQVMVGETSESTYQNYLTSQNKYSMLDLNFGMFIYAKSFYFGYSTNQLLGDKIAFSKLNSNILVTHHTFMGGAKWSASDDLRLEPSFLLNTVKAAPSSFTLNLKGVMKDKYYGGLGYRSGDAIIFLAGIKPDERFQIGYSLDINTSQLRRTSSGGHEINLSYFL